MRNASRLGLSALLVVLLPFMVIALIPMAVALVAQATWGYLVHTLRDLWGRRVPPVNVRLPRDVEIITIPPRQRRA